MSIGIGDFVQALGVDLAWPFREDFAGVPFILSRTEFVRKRKGESSRDAHARPLRPPTSPRRRKLAREPRPLLGRYYMQDSSAFIIVKKFGGWPFGDDQWAEDTDYIAEKMGQEPEHVACRDLMCEREMLAILGTTVRQNQEFTLRSYLRLRELRPRRAWMPILQGWEEDDYERHADMYEARGVDLRQHVVGVGSVCKRKGKALRAAPRIFGRLKARGLRFHAFGFDVRGTDMCVEAGVMSFDGNPGMVSGDTRAYGAGARQKYAAMLGGEDVDPALYLIPGHDRPGPGRSTGHTNCGCGCPEWDLRAHARHVERIVAARDGRVAPAAARIPRSPPGRSRQLDLFGTPPP